MNKIIHEDWRHYKETCDEAEGGIPEGRDEEIRRWERTKNEMYYRGEVVSILQEAASEDGKSSKPLQNTVSSPFQQSTSIVQISGQEDL